MDKHSKELLNLYQSEDTRNTEENFAQMLSENESVRLFFINENRAFTDGKNIVVDPAFGEVFADKKAIQSTEKWMQIPNKISSDQWLALHMVTRSQSIHEILHILYTKFPLMCLKDKRATSKIRLKTLSMIANIIEDAYIEAVGCSEYDNLEMYLLFGRVSKIFASAPFEGTVSQVFGKVEVVEQVKKDIDLLTNKEKLLLLQDYLNYMGGLLLYPMLESEEPSEQIKAYIENTKVFFFDGSICINTEKRYEYTDLIFDMIEELIPDTSDDLDTQILEKMLGGIKTHSANPSTMISSENKLKIGKVHRRLTVDLDGKRVHIRDLSKQIKDVALLVENDKKMSMMLHAQQGRTIIISGGEYDCSVVHSEIEIIEKKPIINFNLKRAYQNIYNKYHLNINSYNARFTQLLKAPVAAREKKKLYGSGIDSRQLGDIKKRYWYKNTIAMSIPDIAIMLMIDGSGSMSGARVEGARIASVIFHEVLKKQGIEHAIVEHRAIYDELELHHNILVDYQAKEEEKYNILGLDADEGTREGLSLYWAERYIMQHTTAEHRLLVVLSDGVPEHGIDGPACYIPPVSIKDTANAVRKIRKRGTDIIAIALDDDGDSCYNELKEMYPYVISCTDLKKLTGQLLGLITKNMLT